MKVAIKSFKCASDQRIELVSPSVVLLKGRSGVGKSTLLNAVAWCLYGRGKQVAPWGQDKATTQVSVTIDSLGLSVFRQRAPRVFTVTYGGGSYSDEAGQSVINQLLGDYSVWMAACYIPQNGKSHILAATGAERLSILESLSFQGESPELYIQKVNELIISGTASLKSVTDSHGYLRSAIQLMGANLPNMKYVPSATLKAGMKAFVDGGVAKGKELNDVTVAQGRLVQLDKSLATIGLRLCSLTEPSSVPSPAEVTRLERLEAIANVVPLYNRLKEDIKHVSQSNFQEADLQVTESTLANAEWDIKNYDLYLSSLTSMGLTDDPKQWEIEIQRLTDRLSLQKRLYERDKLRRTEQEAGSLLQLGVANDELLMKLTMEHRGLTERSRILVCPSCKAGVCFTGNGLVCAKESPVSQEEISKSEQLLAKTRVDNERHKKYAQLMSVVQAAPQDLRALEGDPLSASEEASMNNRLYGIKSLRQKQKPTHDIQKLKRTLESNRNKIRLNELTTQLNSLTFSESECEQVIAEGPSTISQKLRDVRAALWNDAERKHLIKEKEELEAERVPLQAKVAGLPALMKEIQQRENRIHELSEQLGYAQKVEQLQPMMTELERLEAEAKKVGDTLNNLSIIRDTISLCRYKVLCNTVMSINRNLSEICKELFEEGLSISLQLCKDGEMNSRNAISLSVMYKGHECGSLADLSGGEFDRACLAISISILKSTNLPFVMLDESFGSLDHRTREQCLTMLKQHLNDRLVICVDHGGTEGYYDRVIKFS